MWVTASIEQRLALLNSHPVGLDVQPIVRIGATADTSFDIQRIDRTRTGSRWEHHRLLVGHGQGRLGGVQFSGAHADEG